ncbi:unnamed protein product [Adineta steineri]|uniref:ABC transporter domain-containing protein n=1 Tax=Adineta steineri TaxID=433720 RepID=A0A815SFZ2_9BILA|nr:unnamed protein product [Adineta steineri]CAF3998024.1 unnamed protein product [Adineta steineri]
MKSMIRNDHGDYGSIEHENNSTSTNGNILSNLFSQRNYTKMRDDGEETSQISLREQIEDTKEITMSWSNITVEVIKKEESRLSFWSKSDSSTSRHILVNGVSGIVRPGEVLAVMGTSAAGKTTLLNALSGYSDRQELNVTGSVMLNGCVTTTHQRRSSNIIGYVEQQELFCETLTVQEHLLFQAMLRMSSKTLTDDDRRKRVLDTIKLLSMEKCVSTTISKLSGGERKRLAFAAVALTDPSIMLIDEPTSNLDSYLAKSLMNTIHMFAIERRRSIIVVLHQPTTDMFKYLDKLCVLSHYGRQAFFSNSHSQAIDFFTNQCGLTGQSIDEFIEQISSNSNVGEDVSDEFDINCKSSLIQSIESINDKSLNDSKLVSVNFFRQLKWLLWYSSVGGARSPIRTSRLSFRLLLMGIIFGLAYFQLDPSEIHYVQNLNSLPFIIGMSLVVSSMGVIAMSLLNERILLIRDIQRKIYSLQAYYLAKFLSDSIFIIIISIFYSIIIVLLVNMKELGLMILVISLEALAGCAVASLMASSSSSILIILLLLHPFNIIFNQFTGVFISLKSIPDYFKWLQYLSYYYYGYSSMLILQWRNVAIVQEPCEIFSNDTISISSSVCYRSGIEILKEYGVQQHDLNFNISMLITLILGYHLASFIILFIRIRRIS